MKSIVSPKGTVVILLMLFWSSPAFSENKIIGLMQCSDSNCHSNIVEHHQKHPHETFFNEKYEADGMKIAKAMKVKDHFEDKKCIQCHGTEVASSYAKITEEEKGLFGVICETCHNPAEDWVEIHDKKGKIPAAIEKGMRPTRSLYQWPISCFNCHRGVGEEYLRAGHKIGEKFDLLKYSQGDFKHWNWNKQEKKAGNLEQKLKTKHGKIWVAGNAFQVQYSIMRIAESSGSNGFTEKNFALLQKAIKDLKSVAPTPPSGSLDEILALAEKVGPDPKSALAVVDQIKKLVKKFIQEIETAKDADDTFASFPVPEEKSFIKIKKK